MLAVCSDLDETPDRHAYWEIARFLNTTESTAMGPGVGLEVGNSIYFDMPPDQFAYWNTDDAGREMVRTLIHSGHIDVLHSYGDLATTRADAGRALDELARHDCHLAVWVDHSKAITNFGSDIMFGQGDVPDSMAYHADLTVDYGIRYVSRGRATSVTGQDIPADLRGIHSLRHPVASARTLAKEATKQLLSRFGHEKYTMHHPNRVVREISLRDGRRVHEMLRCNPYWGGVGEAATAAGVAECLTDTFLDRLTRRGGVCVFYTHLGKVCDPKVPFNERTCEAFRRLARAHRAGNILVTTTKRLLRYVTVRDSLQYHAEHDDGRLRITIESVNDPVDGAAVPSAADLEGITFAVPHSGPVDVQLEDGSPIACETSQDREETFVTIPWRPLSCPRL